MSTSSQTEQNRAVAKQFCAHLDTKRFDEAAQLFAEGANWLVVASPPDKSWGGAVNGPTMCKQAGDLLAAFEEWSYTIQNITVEGERAVVDGIARGRGPGGHRYDNNYLMQFVVRGEKIVDFKECLDAYQVEQWFKTRKAAGLM